MYHQSADDIAHDKLMVDAAKANPDKFSALYDKYYRAIFLFIWKRVTDEEITADITSQVFLNAMLALKKYTHQNLPFSAWLYRIATNEVNMYFRKHSKTRIISITENNITHLIDECKLNERKENREIILNALQQLTPDEIQLIELRFFDEQPFAEIATILNITENNAKVKTYRIIDKLKLWFKNQYK